MMAKYLILLLIIIPCLAILTFGTRDAMASDPTKPSSFAIGPYKLDMPIKGIKGLKEISASEYDIFKKKFEDEKIYKAPSINFLGLTWDMMLGVVKGKIYKISPGYTTKDKNQADEAAVKALTYCKSYLGEPSEQQAGLFIWETKDGNVILQTAATSEGFAVFLFSTTRSAKEFRQLK
jgi:hypothetical protein